MLLKKTILALIASDLVNADSQFKSRPDLSPPVFNISSNYASDISKLDDGYIFVTPYSFGFNADTQTEQPGAYIYKSNGDLVWSGFTYFGGTALNFQANFIDNKPILYAFEGQFSSRGGHGFGHIKVLGDDYKVVKELSAGHHEFIDIHEFHLVDNNQHGLVEIYSPRKSDLTQFNKGENERQWVVDAIVQEIDVDTNELLFEWRSLDHVSPKNSLIDLTSNKAGDGLTAESAWDYFHINSVDKNSKGDYIVSARHTSTIYKINGKTGEVIWRLSSQGKSDLIDVGSNKLNLGYQHHARFIEEQDGDIEIISFFDNAAYSSGHTEPEDPTSTVFSSGKIVKVDNKNKTVELVEQFDPPKEHKLTAKSQGSFQFLPNGNKLINWGSAGAITEHDSEGNVIFFTKLDSGVKGPYVQSYRAFKHPWVGRPTEDIAFATEVNGDNTKVYISWNGDTLTDRWEIFDLKTHETVITFNKAGFETEFTIKGYTGDFAVVAYDAEGHILKATATPDKQYKHFSLSNDASKPQPSLKQNVLSYFSWRPLFA